MSKHSRQPSSPILSLSKPWDINDNSIWLGSTLSLYRNLEKFMFPAKLSADRLKQIVDILGKEVLSNESLVSPKLILAEDTTPLEKEYLFEHFLGNETFQHAHGGEAFIIDETGNFLATLNHHDHLRMQIIDCQGEIESAWSKLVKIETSIGKKIPFAYSPKFGFLTSNPADSGTGLLASVLLQVTALIQLERVDEMLDKYADEFVTVTGLQGNPTEIIGDVIAIQNTYRLGVSEENSLSTLRSLTTKLLVEENRARQEIKTSQNPDFKDLVSRAYGILIHSYQIEAVEALNAISILKLGLELGWIKGLTLKEINQLFFVCRRSHLLSITGDHIPKEEIPHKRAEYIHQALKDATLLT